MDLKKIVVGMAAVVCSGLFYEVDYVLTYILSSDYAAEEVRFYDNFFSVLLLAIGLWLLLQEVISYIKSMRTKKK